MRLTLTERFQKDVNDLAAPDRGALFTAILALPKALGQPHVHGGLGLRKVHASGIWEARIGLGLRLVFTLAADALTLVRAGSHEDIKRYLRSV